jgi:hypothetical protein
MKTLQSTLKKTKQAIKKQPKKAVEKVCSCRVPVDEYIQLENELYRLGYKNMSHYFREIILTRKREHNLSELEQYKIFLVNKISNNVNQIAKVMHQDIKKSDEVDYKKTHEKLELYLNELYGLMGS